MGKEWHFGGRSSRRVATATTDHRRNHPSLPGCMSALFHLFHFHSSHFTAQFLFNKHHHPPSFNPSHHPPFPKASPRGVEAPRNSLELDETSISWLRKEENLHIPMGIQIKTSRKVSKKPKASEQQLPNIDHIASSESPSAKTPNLLARLMGLDILPQTSSSSYHHLRRNPGTRYNVSGTLSLPESPRVSSARQSDVDRCHHSRLSLQISLDKENPPSTGEWIEQEKERRRKKVALVDITNNNGKLEFGEQEVGFSRSKAEKSSKRLKKMVADESSSKLRNQEVIILKKQKPKQMQMQMPMPMPMQKTMPREDGKKKAFGCPTNNLPNNLNRPTVIPVKKDPPPPAAKIPHEQPCSYPKGKQKQPAGDGGERNAVASTATTDGGGAEFNYIKTIITSNGISMDIPVSNPLDPSLFHNLEAAAGAAEEPMRHRCNRRLLFDLVDEVVGEILRSERKKKSSRMEGWELAEKVREKVEEFPRANCQVLEDIDALIDKDLPKSKLSLSTMAEADGIVMAVELHVLDSLLRETAAAIASICPYKDGVVLTFSRDR